MKFNQIDPGTVNEILWEVLTTEQYQRVLAVALTQRKSLLEIAISLPLVSTVNYDAATAAASDRETVADALVRKELLTRSQYKNAVAEYQQSMAARSAAPDAWAGEREILASAKLLTELQIEAAMVTLGFRGWLKTVSVPAGKLSRFVRLSAVTLYHSAGFYGRRSLLNFYYSPAGDSIRRRVRAARRKS